MREFDSRYIDGAVDGGGFYQLDVDVNSISFSHHHLFSREHVLAHKLTLLNSEYMARAKRNMAGFLTEKVTIRSFLFYHPHIERYAQTCFKNSFSYKKYRHLLNSVAYKTSFRGKNTIESLQE